MKDKPSGTAAFSLVELLVVVGIVTLLVAVLIPAVGSLSKSSGRKGAASVLLGALEQARTQAIKDGRATYLVFPAQPPDNTSSITDPAILERYFYHSFAVFQDDPTDVAKPKVQLTAWKFLPLGISLRTEISFSSPSTTTNSAWSAASFTFTPAGGGAIQSFPFIQFDESGSFIAPTSPNPGPVLLRFFEGYVTGTNERPTNSKNKDEIISIARVTGRGTYIP